MKNTQIQWCHSTSNPIMGCGGCELYPSPASICSRVDAEIHSPPGTSRELLVELIERQYRSLQNPMREHSSALTVTNIWHARKEFESLITSRYGSAIGKAAINAIESSVTCYASKLHLNKALSIFNPSRQANTGYAPTFERVTPFSGRVANTARTQRPHQPEKPWLAGCRHLVFVSDMGDAFSRRCDFDFLRSDVIPAINSHSGSAKSWLWLTKRPELMAEFAESIGGFPPNVCAMTTITSNATLHRVEELRSVQAATRGLSIEPLWEGISVDNLNLAGIDWVIVGGESGKLEIVRPFHVEWAEELYRHCTANGVAFFLKQLGRNPIQNGQSLTLTDKHGGDWMEWPEHLRIRQMPAAFYEAGV